MGGRLLQQFVCDAWASIDQSRLTWAANNQKRLRAELYSGLQDHLAQDGQANVGRVILPSTHKGSVHHMQQLLQDSLAICQEYRKPDLFITMTANANWPEITENLLPGMLIIHFFLFFHLVLLIHVLSHRSDCTGLT